MPATMIIKSNNTFTIDVSVSDSNKYDDAVQLKFEHNFGFGEVHKANEIFLTPIEMELLGRFLIRQAEELENIQRMRKEEITE